MRDAIGTASAATLGYITGGIKGGARAAQAYRQYSNRKNEMAMASNKRKASVSGMASTRRRPEKRRKSVGKGVVVRQKSRGGYNGNGVMGASRKTGNVSKKPRGKPVKVSMALRKKILKVLDNDKLVGKYLHVQYFQMTPGKPFSGAFDDQQSTEYCGMITTQGSGPSPAQNRLLFSPMWVMYAVGRLINAAIVTKAAGLPISFSEITAGNLDEYKYLSPTTARIKVLKQHTIYRLRNNLGRTVTLKVYVLQPKSLDTVVPIVGTNPVDVWNSGMDLQDNTVKGENPTGCRLETLYANPKWVSQFKHHYKVEETIVNIEAGKEYNFKVDGPSMEYDFAKFWTNNAFIDKQKFTKQVMFVAFNDLVRTSGGTTGRYTDQNVNDPSSILIEQTSYIKYAIPEQVGFVIQPTFILGNNQTLNQKRYCYGIDVHQGVQEGVVDYVGDENPIDEAAGTVV